MLSPGDNLRSYASFAHVLEGSSRSPDFATMVRKVTRGPIFHLQSASYFIGKTVRDDFDHVSNFEILVLSRDELLIRRPVHDGLILSAAAANQPIISRIVLVPLGNRKSFGRRASDADFPPDEFPIEQLFDRLSSDVGTSILLGGEKIIGSSPAEHISSLYNIIRTHILNVPRIDYVRNKNPKEQFGQGAIEIWGTIPDP